jgi:hypothetical protein
MSKWSYIRNMSLPSVLFIPDRFSDYRMWYDIPDRLRGRAEVIHFDQHEQVPWTADSAEFVDAARRLAPGGGFHLVAGAGRAARFAFALAEAGLAKGLVFFQPVLDSIPDDVRVGLSSLDVGLSGLDEALEAFRPIVSALQESDPGRRREILLQTVRDTAGPDREPAGVELELAMMSDHAEEFFAHLRITAAAADNGPVPPDPQWMERPWIDRLAELTVPVTAIGVGPFPEAIARRAKDAEIVLAAGNGGMAPPADRARAVEALLRMLDRIS